MAKAKVPKINWLKAVVLERKETLGWRFDELGSAVGCTGNYCQSRFKEDPEEWPAPFREKVFKLFGISKEIQQILVLLTLSS